MNLQLVENLEKQSEKIEVELDKIEEAGGDNFAAEESPEYMATYRKSVEVAAKRYQAVFGSEIQFNEDRTQFRVVTRENKGTKFW